MEDTLVQLNFFALCNQNISFQVFRKKFKGETKRDGLYKQKLPNISHGEEFDDYLISFKPLDNFESFLCSSRDNPFVTLKMLKNCLLEKIEEVFSSNEYHVERQKITRPVYIVIERHKEGEEVISIEPYYLRVDDKFGFLVNFKFRRKKEFPFSRKIQQLSLSLNKNGRANINYYSDKYDKIKEFTEYYIKKIFPLSKGNKKYEIERRLYSISPYKLKTKIYILNNQEECNSQFNGIKDYGPLKEVKNDILWIFIFLENQRSIANDVFKALIGKTYKFTFPGMERMFGLKLSKSNVCKIYINSYSKNDLINIEEPLDKILNENRDKKVIGIFIEKSRDSYADSDFSPYFFLKYMFTKKHLPMQALTIEKIKGRDGLKWSASNIGLQIFAKLGGIPWKLKPQSEKCVIFGIGSAHKVDVCGNVVKYFAYSVCIDSSGIYRKVDVLADSKDRSNYIMQLKRNIKEVIFENIDEGIDKCVIHLPFKIKKDEMNSIKQSISDISVKFSKTDFQFIKINTKNKFFGFAENNSKVPYESSYLKLSDQEYLVWFEGLQYGKENVNKKIGNPVHIEFINDSVLTESHKKKYLQDIINLSGANWRGFNAKLSPISIYYPEIIANFVSEYRKYSDDDNLDLSNFPIPWFL